MATGIVRAATFVASTGAIIDGFISMLATASVDVCCSLCGGGCATVAPVIAHNLAIYGLARLFRGQLFKVVRRWTVGKAMSGRLFPLTSFRTRLLSVSGEQKKKRLTQLSLLMCWAAYLGKYSRASGCNRKKIAVAVKYSCVCAATTKMLEEGPCRRFLCLVTRPSGWCDGWEWHVSGGPAEFLFAFDPTAAAAGFNVQRCRK